ncbi:hypothetical protein ACLESO_30350 [Pyxidicoccus sp. 3LG]
MRRPARYLCLLTLGLTVGCPTAHRRDGTLDRAMRKDAKKRLETDRCNRDEYREFCEGQENSAECLVECF